MFVGRSGSLGPFKGKDYAFGGNTHPRRHGTIDGLRGNHGVKANRRGGPRGGEPLLEA